MEENNNKLYPDLSLIKENPNNSMDPYHKIDTLKIKNNQNKINNFLLEMKQLEDLLKHYKKLKLKWTSIDSSLKVGLTTIGGILGVTSVVLTGVSTLGGSLILYVGVGIGALTSLSSFIGESVSVGISSKKKKINREICECIEHGIDKLYLYQLRALEDGILKTSEIEKAKEIIKEVKKDIAKIKSGFKIDNVEKDIKSKIKKELEDELREKLKILHIKT